MVQQRNSEKNWAKIQIRIPIIPNTRKSTDGQR